MLNPISNLQLTCNVSKESLVDFSPEKKAYEIEVPGDCFGLLLRLTYQPEFYISVRSDRDAGRFGYAALDPEMGDYLAGAEIPYYEYYDGYIVRLDKREGCFDEDLVVNLSIDAGSEHGKDRYDIRIRRRSNKALRELFTEGEHFDEEYGIRMPYELYVPSKYDKRKKYPLVVSLHGTGEIQEPVSAVLKKMEIATAWAADAEQGHNECLVLAPQCTIRYDEDDNWTTLNQFISHRSESPFWPMPQLTVLYRLIERIKGEYRVDEDRIYMTGVSSGAFGAFVFAMEHPGMLAGLVCACGAANPARIQTLKGLPMWIFHSEDDPLIVPAYTLEPTLAALDEAGVEYRLTKYPKGQVFWQSAHFCWEVLYKDRAMRDWLFAQKNGLLERVKAVPKRARAKKAGHAISEDVSGIARKALDAASGLDAI